MFLNRSLCCIAATVVPAGRTQPVNRLVEAAIVWYR